MWVHLCCLSHSSVWIQNCVKRDFKVRSGTFPSTLSFLEKVYYLLCRSVSCQGQVIPPICFKMPKVVTVSLHFGTTIPQWIPSSVFLPSLQMILAELSSKLHSIRNLKERFIWSNHLHKSKALFLSHSESCYNGFNLDIGRGFCLQLIMNTDSVSFPNILLRPPLITTDSMVHDVMFN